jgi:hypothetical protein
MTNLNTTAIYVQVADGKRGEPIDRLDPFDKSCHRELGMRDNQQTDHAAATACHLICSRFWGV